MSLFRIVADSCADYTPGKDTLDFIQRVPLTISLGERVFHDDGTIDTNELLSAMATSPEAPKSSCPSPQDYLDAFGSEGDVYVVTLSDKVSGSYSSARIAAGYLYEQQPERKIHVFNSRSAAAGQVALCLKLKELAECGLTFEEVVAEAEIYSAEMNTWFVLETLEVFRKNGRLSHIQSLLTEIVSIKMVMGADADGNIVIRGKALNMKRALLKLKELVKEANTGLNWMNRQMVITHAACRNRAEVLRDSLKEAGFVRILLCAAGGLSTVYANAGGIILAI
ncbi:MAG: DegV family protein [Christensenellales bacterium]|jgi:DegV family protein with EDD domain